MYEDTPDHLIPVVEVETSLSRRRRKKDVGFYVCASYAELEGLSCRASSKAEVLLWLHLKSLQATKGAEAWVRPNPRILTAWGVGERTRQRAFASLKRAGLIEVFAAHGRKSQARLVRTGTDRGNS